MGFLELKRDLCSVGRPTVEGNIVDIPRSAKDMRVWMRRMLEGLAEAHNSKP